MDWPPGFVGEVAKFIFNSSVLPVKEISIVAAIGLMAGICGKAYNIAQSGLNIYMILVGPSAIGKEALHSGVRFLINAVCRELPEAANFVDSRKYVSGPALMKAVLAKPSFINIIGEFGHTLKRISADRSTDANIQGLREVIINLYQKSGAASEAGGLGYSDVTQNVESVSGVAYSLMGETTPGKLYESLTQSIMEDGFLSRFTIVECPRYRPELVEDPVTEPDEALLNYLCGICSQSLQLIAKGHVEIVTSDPAATDLLNKFNQSCRTQINLNPDDETQRQMYNRAHLKAKRMAALFAVSDNPFNPVINKEHAEYAIGVIRRDISIMSSHITTGDIGTGDDARENKIIAIIKAYLSKPLESADAKLKALHDDGIITRAHIQNNIGNIKSFRDHPLQATAAMDLALKSLIESGYIRECDKMKLSSKYGFSGKCYQPLRFPEKFVKTKPKLA